MTVRLDQIERGNILRELIAWYETQQVAFARRLNALRARSRRAAVKAGFTSRDIEQLVREARALQVKAL